MTTARASTLDEAFDIHPERFKGKQPTRLIVRDKVYVNAPLKKDTETRKTRELVMNGCRTRRIDTLRC